MEFLNDHIVQTQILQAIVPLLMVVLFTQSGLDKVFDFRGNLEWMTGHFSKTLLRSVVRPSLIAITVMELGAALLCAAGVMGIWFFSSTSLAFWGLVLSVLTLLKLFTGQRIAKEYAGAATIAMYVLIVAAGLFFLKA